jgi:hypothetical protein
MYYMIKTNSMGMEIQVQEDIPIQSPVLKSTQPVQKHSSQRMGGYLECKKILDLEEY